MLAIMAKWKTLHPHTLREYLNPLTPFCSVSFALMYISSEHWLWLLFSEPCNKYGTSLTWTRGGSNARFRIAASLWIIFSCDAHSTVFSSFMHCHLNTQVFHCSLVFPQRAHSERHTCIDRYWCFVKCLIVYTFEVLLLNFEFSIFIVCAHGWN